jgi:hypothetical protein
MKYSTIHLFLILALPLADASFAGSDKPASASSNQPGPDCSKGKAAVKRRAVPAAIERRPPALTPPSAVTLPRSSPPTALLPARPPTPLPVTGCDPGGCRDADGHRYNGPTGNTYLDQSGKPCSRTGTWVQCF